ncbi:aminotransferase class V-fold PLP-dependent enzyme [Paenibacillus sp. MMS20-IR301]|uniref:pyridoxal-phosphate-dependent aminotransferase family protein n=1 Tax=Paenibacillus sp. MMS20-IR301 TaxID=2895946 RepID=UPI0028ECA039|nr:aminotransferase class V-fold PLP-dependent enzyme [Paenibacillus sp. MMS20-IR301]WNS45319.1 aminotransferase class V-fold PLP-dependent enzyme [Paenibacillus sp. MMS20-IR301]
MSQQYKGYVPLTLAEFNQLTEQLSVLLATEHPAVIIPGEAILGIEAVAAGIAAPGRTILNVVTGPYGSLFGQWLERGGAAVAEVKVSFDEVVTIEKVAAAIEQFQPVAISFVQAEVVTGGSNPAEAIFRLARQHNLITVTDSVSAVGGEALLVDEWAVDFAVIGAQKALAGPNGISAVSISPRGWQFLASNERAPRNSILSLLDLQPAPDGAPPLRVPPNIPVLEARALIQALAQVEDEGLPQVITRHERAASAAVAGIRALGLEPWQKNSSHYSTLTTTVRIQGADKLLIKQPIGIVAPGDGELYGQLLRINHFGQNASRESVETAVQTLAGLLAQDAGPAVLAVRTAWGE